MSSLSLGLTALFFMDETMIKSVINTTTNTNIIIPPLNEAKLEFSSNRVLYAVGSNPNDTKIGFDIAIPNDGNIPNVTKTIAPIN